MPLNINKEPSKQANVNVKGSRRLVFLVTLFVKNDRIIKYSATDVIALEFVRSSSIPVPVESLQTSTFLSNA